MRASINQLTTPGLSFEESLRVYRDARFEAVGIWGDKVGTDERAALEAWEQAGLRCSSLTPSCANILWTDRLPGPQAIEDRLVLLRTEVERVARFRPAAVVFITGPCRRLSRIEARRHVVDALAVLGEAAARAGTRIALEPIHPSLEGFSFVTALDDTMELVEAADHPAVGLMVDLFHLWDVADVEAKIAAYGDRIFAVQISDWREPQRAWSDRVLPGDGIAPLASLVRALEASGYVGDYELEIMSDDGRYEIRLEDSLWLEDPAAVATRGYARLEALLAEGGVGAVANQR